MARPFVAWHGFKPRTVSRTLLKGSTTRNRFETAYVCVRFEVVDLLHILSLQFSFIFLITPPIAQPHTIQVHYGSYGAFPPMELIQRYEYGSRKELSIDDGHHATCVEWFECSCRDHCVLSLSMRFSLP